MIPSSGFYCVFDDRQTVDPKCFNLPGLPLPQPASPACGVSTWNRNGDASAVTASDGNRHLVFHGKLCNRQALLEELSLPAATPDGQLLLHAWARWPSDWTDRLDDLYALAHWTGTGRDLTLRRDASGALGLFYARTASGNLAFSSHLGTLVRLPGVNRRLARQGLHEYLRMLDIAPPNTIYEGVRALPAGEGVVLDALRPASERVLPPRAIPPVDVPFDDAVMQLETRLTASIAHRLDGTARPAAFLSGGVDSSLICALAARQRPDLQTLTVGFDGAGYDETPIARAVAGHLGLGHRVLRFDRKDFLGALARAGRYAEQPMADPAGPATLLAFEQVQPDHDVVLDGTGADEQAGAMPPRHVRVAVEYTAHLPIALRHFLGKALPRMPGLAGYAPLFDFEHPAETMMRWHGFRRQEIEALCGEPASFAHTRFYEVFARFPRSDHYARYSALLDAMPSDRLNQAALISGLDVRFPFCDPEVEAWLRGQPLAHRWQEGSAKHILRALLARHVPRQLWDLPKHGFDFPLLEFLSADSFHVVRRYLLNDRWASWQVLSPERVAEYGRRLIAGEHTLRFRVWALVVLAAWLEGHLD
jgi:asparagine synthase (glutamine-hydrolysing)